MTPAERLLRVLGAITLISVAMAAPMIGYGVADHFEGRKLLGIMEGDWFFLFGFLAAAVCLWAAVYLVKSTVSS